MLPPTVAQKNGNHFHIIFADHIFSPSNTGLSPKAPKISSLEVSKTAYSNVSLKCEVAVRPSDCWDSSLQWYFNNSSVKLKSGEKYVIQERKTNTRCNIDFILTIVNVTEADEGGYKCQYLCDKYYPSQSKSSTIQLKVFPPSGTDTPVISKVLVSRNLSKFKKWKTPPNWVKHKNNRSKDRLGEGGRVTRINFCWVCAAGLSEPLPHYSLFCGQL